MATNDSRWLLLLLVVGVIVWLVYRKAEDEATSKRENEVLVRRLDSQRQFTDGRRIRYGSWIYNLPLLSPPSRSLDGYGLDANIVETWHYSDQDRTDPKREVANRFPNWMFMLREPTNEFNRNAISIHSLDYNIDGLDVPHVYRGDRQIGYLDERDANRLSPILDRYPTTRIPLRRHHSSFEEFFCWVPKDLDGALKAMHKR